MAELNKNLPDNFVVIEYGANSSTGETFSRSLSGVTVTFTAGPQQFARFDAMGNILESEDINTMRITDCTNTDYIEIATATESIVLKTTHRIGYGLYATSSTNRFAGDINNNSICNVWIVRKNGTIDLLPKK